ncbi:hypothetical protein RCL1_006351 [Eukaryota sp. TZLM3-RCL]
MSLATTLQTSRANTTRPEYLTNSSDTPSNMKFLQHNSSLIIFDRTDAVPLPSFLFHEPLRSFYNNPFSEFAPESETWNKHESCEWFYYFNVFRGLFTIEDDRQYYLNHFLQFLFKNQTKMKCDRNFPYWCRNPGKGKDTVPDGLILGTIDQFVDQFTDDFFEANKLVKEDMFDKRTTNSEASKMMTDYPLLVVELKTERSQSCSSDPMLQCAAYAVQYLGNNPLFLEIGAPCLLLLLDGTHVHCYSMGYCQQGPFDSTSKFVVSLIADFDFSRPTDNSWRQFYSFFSKLRTTALQLHAYVNSMFTAGTTTNLPAFPQFKTLKFFTGSYKVMVVRHKQTEIKQMVKLVEGNYGKNVHDYLYTSGYAPKCIDVQKCGDWNIVIMEMFEETKKLTELTEIEFTSISHQLDEISNLLAQSKFVHGDLRIDNFVVIQEDSGLKVKVLDFDCAGEEGNVRYPFDVNIVEKAMCRELFITHWENMKTERAEKCQRPPGTYLQPVILDLPYEQFITLWHEEVFPGALVRRHHDEFMMNLVRTARLVQDHQES